MMVGKQLELYNTRGTSSGIEPPLHSKEAEVIK
jgi:hypothetical protein